MDTFKNHGRGIFIKRRLDPLVKVMLKNKKIRRLSVIVQSAEYADERVKKYIKKYGGKITGEYPFINALNVLMPPAE